MGMVMGLEYTRHAGMARTSCPLQRQHPKLRDCLAGGVRGKKCFDVAAPPGKAMEPSVPRTLRLHRSHSLFFFVCCGGG